MSAFAANFFVVFVDVTTRLGTRLLLGVTDSKGTSGGIGELLYEVTGELTPSPSSNKTLTPSRGGNVRLSSSGPDGTRIHNFGQRHGYTDHLSALGTDDSWRNAPV